MSRKVAYSHTTPDRWAEIYRIPSIFDIRRRLIEADYLMEWWDGLL